MNGRKKSLPLLIGIPLSTVLLFLINCSTVNWPITAQQNISESEKALNEAKAVNASAFAPTEMKSAEEKLSMAKKEYANGWHHDASRLANEAAVDAELARAKATSDKDKKTVQELQENIESLRREIERQSK